LGVFNVNVGRATHLVTNGRFASGRHLATVSATLGGEVLLSLVPFLLLTVACTSPGGEADLGADTASDPGDTAASTGPSGAARLEPSCAPSDGPAVRLIVGMGEPGCDSPFSSVAHVRITLWEGVEWPLADGTYAFDSRSGSAWYARTDGAPEESGRSGTVTVSTAPGGTTTTGGYLIDLGAGEVVEGTFEAVACGTGELCG